jgi:4-amino-4-deoxy-L-arabinose transferase-like glycosyltransferase
MYAAIALASLPRDGVTEWSARLPSSIAATLMVFLFYWYFGRQFGKRAGLVAGLTLPMSFLCLDKSTVAEIDMLQAFWVSASILFFLRGLEVIEHGESKNENRIWKVEDGSATPQMNHGRRIEFIRVSGNKAGVDVLDHQSSVLEPPSSVHPPQSSLWLWWLLAFLCIAGGVLTKWTGAAFFYGTVIPLLWWRGRLRLLWGRHHLICASLAAVICLAWVALAVSMTSWQEFYGTVSREALMRLSPSHHHRPYPFGETLVHPLRLFAAALPCSAFALMSLKPGFSAQWDEGGHRLLQALHCWTWFNMLFWTAIPEHATRHSFPLFPGIAGLSALVWISWLRGLRSKCLSPRRKPSDRNPWAWRELTWRISPPNLARVFVGLVIAWLVVKLVFVEVVLPRRNPMRQPKEKGERLATLVPEQEVLYLFRLKDEGIMFYYGRTVRRLAGPAQLPSSNQPLYCILDETEWRTWSPTRSAEMLLTLPDEQGDPIVLVRVEPAGV